MKTKNLYLKALPLCLAQLVVLAPTVFAQGAVMSDRAMERSHWYSAPREYQIVDQRPIINDFRTAPVKPGQIAIPPGPGAAGGPGGGSLGDPSGGAGGSSVIPDGGLPVGGGSAPGYRSDPSGMSSLPKSGFGGSNIPVGGMAPRGILPGVNQSVVGKIMQQNKYKPAAVPARAVAARGPAVVNAPTKPSAPSVNSYGTNYSSPNSYGSGLNSSQKVVGHLLRQK
jgi:hypothetical protein